ncbi:hypothetical protein TNCV_3566731 [Trichonephila clavipes]|nr:hypothetical protein TNCV_3566731 [Trichonephila clavipes]
MFKNYWIPHNQELIIDELIKMHDQEQDIEELVFGPGSIRRSNDEACNGEYQGLPAKSGFGPQAVLVVSQALGPPHCGGFRYVTGNA